MIEKDFIVSLKVDMYAAAIANHTVYLDLKDFNQTVVKSNRTYAIQIEIRAENTPPHFVKDITALLNVTLT